MYRLALWRLSIAFTVLAAALPRLLTVGHFQNNDEYRWIHRSNAFTHALAQGRPSDMSAATAKGWLFSPVPTMPGVTTMWLGGIGHLLWRVSKIFGLVPKDAVFVSSTSGVHFAQATIAVACSLLIGLLAWLVGKWTSPRVGLAAGMLLATEPFWVGLGAWIHTDELTALFGITGIVTLLIALGLPDVSRSLAHPTRCALAAGALLICSPLSKLTGNTFVFGVAASFAAVFVRDMRTRELQQSWTEVAKPVLQLGGYAMLGAFVTAMVLYPALWASPGRELTRLWHSVSIGTHDPLAFYGGSVHPHAPWTFYGVALPLRLTPWLTILCLVGIPLAFIRKSSRSHAVLLLAFLVPAAIVLSLARSKFDRYGLILLAPIVVMACLALDATHQLSARLSRAVAPTVLVGGVVALAITSYIAPFGLAFYNPIVGGHQRASRMIHTGWGGGWTEAFAMIRSDAAKQGKTCDEITVEGPQFLLTYWGDCGVHLIFEEPDYRAIYISTLQRSSPALAKMTEGRVHVGDVQIMGQRYVSIWRKPQL